MSAVTHPIAHRMSNVYIQAKRLLNFQVASATVIGLMTGLTMLTEKLQIPATIVSLVVYAGMHIVRRDSLINWLPRPRWAFGVLLFMLAATLWISAFPDITLPQVLRTLIGIVCFAAIVHVVGECQGSDDRCAVLVGACGAVLIAMGFALALAAPFVVDWQGASKLPFVPAALYSFFTLKVSDSVNPNVMAGALVITVPLAAAIVIYTRAQSTSELVHLPAWPFWMSLVVSVGVMAMLLLMQSRSALLALFFVLLLLTGLRWRQMRPPLFVLGLGACAAFLLLPNAARLLFVSSNGAVTGSELDQRTEIWTRAWYIIQDFPFTGIGIGSFQQVTDPLYPFVLNAVSIPHAHNLFLQVAVDLGIPGLIAWLGILGYVCLSAWRAYRYGDGWVRALGAGLLASNVALCVHGLTDAVTWGMVRSAPLVWLLWGTAVAAGQTALDSHRANGKVAETQST